MPYTPLQLAEAFIQTGELEDALEALNQHLEAVPADDDARRLRIQVLMRMPSREYSGLPLPEFDRLAELTADDYVQKSIVLQRLSRYDESSAAMAQAHHMRPGDTRIAEDYIRALIRSRDFATALELLAALPAKWGWLRYAGEIAMMQEQYETAFRHYTAAIDDLDRLLAGNTNPILISMKVGMMSARADMYRRLEQFTQAAAEYEAMEQLEPANPYFRLWRGLCIALSGDVGRAAPLVAEAVATSSGARDDFREEVARDPRLTPLAESLN